ncbi:MAG TPA: rod shape-determining protein MreD [Gemmatimonadaceae bacterium]
MSWLALVRGIGLFLLLVVLHYTVRPLLGMRVTADFLVIAVLVTAVQVRPGVAAVIGLLTGVISDSLTPLSFGAGALALSTVGFSASWLKAAVFGDNVLLQAIFIAAGKWAFDVLYLVAERRLSFAELAVQLAFWSPLSGLATGLAGLVVVALFRRSAERTR